MASTETLVEESPFRWRLETVDQMRVPGIVFATAAMIPSIERDGTLRQVANVATLPGIVEASFAMPDVHLGYGFPIGGVAATDIAEGGVVSPGGVGFDISCGVRLLTASIDGEELRPRLPALMEGLDAAIPRGTGAGGVWRPASPSDLDEILRGGAVRAVERGFGVARDLERCEDLGVMEGAEPEHVSERARARGLREIGSLGSGNHFLEVQKVDAIHDEAAARTFGLRKGGVCVMIHCGSRGLGHQVCTDHVRLMEPAMARFGIEVPDRQLACVPVDSPEGRAYLDAMAAAHNFARANRQVLTDAVRAAFRKATDANDLELLYDVSHNLARLEHHVVGGKDRLVCVQRKGATPALPPGDPTLPLEFRDVGQPVLIPGSMGTASYVLAGVADGPAFHSTCHGAGRAMSRKAAARQIRGAALREELESAGILVRARSIRGLSEEAPFAYKDVDEVVAACEGAGLARRVARLVPLGVVKG